MVSDGELLYAIAARLMMTYQTGNVTWKEYSFDEESPIKTGAVYIPIGKQIVAAGGCWRVGHQTALDTIYVYDTVDKTRNLSQFTLETAVVKANIVSLPGLFP